MWLPDGCRWMPVDDQRAGVPALGRSLCYNRRTMTTIRRALPSTVCRAARALVFGVLVGAVLASASARIAAQTAAFQRVERWAQVPAGFVWGEIADAELDRTGNLWVLHRPPTPGSSSDQTKGGGETPVLMFDASKRLVKSFGKGLFLQPHGLHIDPEGNIWVTDCGPFYAAGQRAGRGFQIFKFSSDGTLLMTLGKPGNDTPGRDTFRGPTDVVVNARGEIFVADGHTPRPGQAGGDRIVKLAKDGTFITAWGVGAAGAPPSEPAKAGVVVGPHRLALDSRGRLFVADRGNRRIQIFDQDGRFLDQWTQFGTPSGIWIDHKDRLYVAVAGDRGGVRVVDVTTGTLMDRIDGISPEVAIADRQGHIFAGLVAGQDLLQFAPATR